MSNAAVSDVPTFAALASVPDVVLADAPRDIVATFFDPLPLTRFPVATLPLSAEVALLTIPSPGVLTSKLWALQSVGIGRAAIDLGDDYALLFDESVSEVAIENRAAQTVTRIFGNAEVEINGKKAYQFWGTTSFALANGILITANTTTSSINPAAYILDKITVTNEQRAVVITGVNNSVLGDLAAQTSSQGFQIDEATRDGYTLDENIGGWGWLTPYSANVATQKDLNVTAPGRLFGSNSNAASLREIERFVSRFIVQSFSYSLNTMGRARIEDLMSHNRHETAVSADDRARWLRRSIELQGMRRDEIFPDADVLNAREARLS
jgi:Domain of Unknown Function (DUF1521)